MKNKIQRSAVLVVVACLVMFSAQVFAHHAALNYDFENLWVLEGTVTRFDFVNPHIAVHFDVTNSKGDIEQWSATGASPNSERRFAWTKNTLQPGDKLIVYGFVQKDGRKTMQMPIIIVNGKVMERRHSTEFRLYEEYKARLPQKLPRSYAGKTITQMEPKANG